MSKILLAAPPLRGHAEQLLVLAEALVQKGYSVLFATGFAFEDRIRAFGGSFVPWDVDEKHFDQSFLQQYTQMWARASRMRSILRGERLIWSTLIDGYQPLYESLLPTFKEHSLDLVIADVVALPAADLAIQHGVPVVELSQSIAGKSGIGLNYPQYGTPYSINMNWSERILNTLHPLVAFCHFALLPARLRSYRAKCAARHGLPFSSKPSLSLIGGQFGFEIPRKLPAHMQLVGPIIPRNTPELDAGISGWLDEAQESGTETLYLSFGTLANVTSAEVSSLIQAFSNSPYNVLWSLRVSDQRVLSNVPPNVRIESNVSQLAVLNHPAVRLFISHGGTNSIYESVWFGKPLIAVPFFGDHHYNAARMCDMGVGLLLNRWMLAPHALQGAVREILTDPRYTERAQHFSRVFRACGGLERTLSVIEQILRAGYDHLLITSYSRAKRRSRSTS